MFTTSRNFNDARFGFLKYVVLFYLKRPKLPVFPVHSCTACFRRWQTTTAMGEEAGDTKEESWLEKAKKRSWLWRWLNDVDEIERNVRLKF